MNSMNRELGQMEKLFELFHSFGAQLVVYVARIEGHINLEYLRVSLDLLQQKHAMLQVQIIQKNDRYYFQNHHTTSIPLKVIERNSESLWESLVEEELHTTFEHPHPLCRVSLVHGEVSELLITLHHSIADGLSGVLIIEDILNSYAAQHTQTDFGTQQKQFLPILPPVEKMTNSRLSFIKKTAYLYSIISRYIRPAEVIFEKTATYSERRVKMLTFDLSKKQTEALVSRCREEQTSVQGALCAALFSGIAAAIPDKKTIRLTCNSFVNLRPFCNVTDIERHIGCLSSGLEATHQIHPKKKFWDLARESKQVIDKNIRSKNPQDHILLVDWLGIKAGFLHKIANQKGGRTAAASVSNCGKLNLPEFYGDLRLKNLYFFSGQHFMGASLWLSAITLHNQLMLGFGFASPVLSQKTALFIKDSVIHQLKYCCQW